MAWRPMTAADIDAVVEVARVAFPDHPEDRACLENRLDLFPAGAWVAQIDGGVVGYLFAYPWTRGSAPALNAVLERLPPDADVLYLHDLALAPAARGRGLTRPAVGIVEDLARTERLGAVALVAVNAAEAFWRGHGFVVEDRPEMAAKLTSYGADARYMTRRL